MRLDCQLSGAGCERHSGHADDVAEVEFFEEFEFLFADLVALDIDLHSARGVPDIREYGFTHRAEGSHASGDRDLFRVFHFRLELLADVRSHLHVVEPFPERKNARCGKLLHFSDTLCKNVFCFLLWCILNVFLAHFFLILSKYSDKNHIKYSTF